MLDFFKERKYFILAIIIFIGFTLYTGEKKERDIIILEEPKEEIREEALDKKEIFYIHVAGNVGRPGLFQMEAGSRLNDLIFPAEILDLKILDKYFNRAELLSDGMKIYIPFPEEVENNSENNFLIDNSKEGEKININKGQLQELMTLPGIGEAKARDIIIFREKNGNFKNIDDIILVKGIGQATFEKIKDLIKT